MKCNVCGKECDEALHYRKLSLCESCYEQIRNIGSSPHDQYIKNTAAAYFASLPDQGYRKLDFSGVNMPITEEYCRKNPEYDNALADDKPEFPPVNDSNHEYVTRREFKNDIKKMQDTLLDIEWYCRCFCILSAILLGFIILGFVISLIH